MACLLLFNTFKICNEPVEETELGTILRHAMYLILAINRPNHIVHSLEATIKVEGLVSTRYVNITE